MALRWVDLANARDASGIAALFTDDAVFIGGPGCAPNMPCRGAAAAAGIVPKLASVRSRFTVVGTPEAAGNVVFIRFESRSDNDARAGIERSIVVANVTVVGGRIASLIGVPELSDAQTLKLQLFARSQGRSRSPSAIAAADPSAALRAYQEAIGRADAQAAAALLADNAATIGFGKTCTQVAPCTARADALRAAESEVADHQKVVSLGSPLAAVDLAQARSEVRADSVTAVGVDRLVTIDTYQVQAGKIVARVVLFDLSDAQTARGVARLGQGR